MTKILPADTAHAFATRAVHAGQRPDPTTGAVMTPIYQTSTYVQDGLGRHKGYEYARTQNPTREALERNVASLEGAEYGFAFGSGLAALDSMLKLLRAGDHVISGDNIYGGTHRLMERIYSRYGVTFTFVDMREIANVERALTPATRMIYCETPTNPMMNLVDLTAVGDLAQAHGFLFVVDNTFATPVLPAAARARRRHGAPLHHQVSERAQRHGGRHPGHQPRRPGRVAGLHPERGRRGPGPDGLLAGTARHQDARAPHAAARRQRPHRGAVAHRAAAGEAGLLSRVSRVIRSTSWPRGRCADSAA